jgi:hypothetical protein
MKNFILMLAVAGCALAQSGSGRAGSITSGGSSGGGASRIEYTCGTDGSGCISSSGILLRGSDAATTTSNIAYSGGSFTFNCGTVNGYITACGGGPSYETRKDDGKGPTLLQVKSTAKPLALRELPPLEYVALAKSVGVEGPVVEQAKMLEMIHNLELHVYDWHKVDDYLYRKALRQGTNVRWVWKPVRSQDTKLVSDISTLTKENVGMIYAKTYDRPLPVRILKRMKEIECEMSDAVFLVSDYEVVKPDPFLAITTRSLIDSGKIWVIDQWDEPGFTDGPELQARR